MSGDARKYHCTVCGFRIHNIIIRKCGHYLCSKCHNNSIDCLTCKSKNDLKISDEIKCKICDLTLKSYNSGIHYFEQHHYVTPRKYHILPKSLCEIYVDVYYSRV